MAPRIINPLTTFIQILFLLQAFQVAIGHRKLIHDDAWKGDLKLPGKTNQDGSNPDGASPAGLEPELNVFFRYNTLEQGTKLPVYFETKNFSKLPRLLSRQESDAIPFSSSQLPHLLKLFSFPVGSKHALAVKSTLRHCEFPPLPGETKFCATSLESMLDSVQEMFGPDSRFRVLTTNYISGEIPALQNYTVSEYPEEIEAAKVLGCHKLPYPYAVFYCHGQAGDRKLYRVLLEGEKGGRVEAMAICHMDTSRWDPSHVAFRVMKTAPGASPVCHFFPADNLVWVPEN